MASLRERTGDQSTEDLLDESKVKILNGEKVVLIPKDSVYAAEQVRTEFDEEELQRLSKSIEDNSQLQPIIVFPQDGKGFQVHQGERRMRAIQMNDNLTHIACIVRKENNIIQQLAENLDRQNLTPMEVGQGFKAVKEQFGLDGKEVAEKMHVSTSTISMYEKVLDAPDFVIEAYRSKLIGDVESINALRIAATHDEQAVKKALGSGDYISRKEAIAIKEKVNPKKKDEPKERKSVRPVATQIAAMVNEREGFLLPKGGQYGMDKNVVSVLFADGSIERVEVENVKLVGYKTKI